MFITQSYRTFWYLLIQSPSPQRMLQDLYQSVNSNGWETLIENLIHPSSKLVKLQPSKLEYLTFVRVHWQSVSPNHSTTFKRSGSIFLNLMLQLDWLARLEKRMYDDESQITKYDFNVPSFILFFDWKLRMDISLQD